MKFPRDIGAARLKWHGRYPRKSFKKSKTNEKRDLQGFSTYKREGCQCHEDASHAVRLIGQGFFSRAKEGQEPRTRNATDVSY